MLALSGAGLESGAVPERVCLQTCVYRFGNLNEEANRQS